MRVTDITISEIRKSHDGKYWTAQVIFDVDGHEPHIIFDCRALIQNAGRVESAVLADGLRQLRQLPRIAQAGERIEFKSHIRPYSSFVNQSNVDSPAASR